MKAGKRTEAQLIKELRRRIAELEALEDEHQRADEALRESQARYRVLLDHAKAAGKIPRGFVIPEAYRNNTPERIAQALGPARERGVLPPYPFGTDFTHVEQRLIPALDHIKRASGSKMRLASLMLGGLAGAPATDEHECLERMRLVQPGTLNERVSALLVKGALRSCSQLD